MLTRCALTVVQLGFLRSQAAFGIIHCMYTKSLVEGQKIPQIETENKSGGAENF